MRKYTTALAVFAALLSCGSMLLYYVTVEFVNPSEIFRELLPEIRKLNSLRGYELIFPLFSPLLSILALCFIIFTRQDGKFISFILTVINLAYLGFITRYLPIKDSIDILVLAKTIGIGYYTSLVAACLLLIASVLHWSSPRKVVQKPDRDLLDDI